MVIENFTLIQKITIILYSLEIIFLFFYTLFKRKKLTLGNFETIVLPAIFFFSLVFTLNFSFSDNLFLTLFGLLTHVFGLILGMLAFPHLGWINSDDFWLGRHEKKPRFLAKTGPYSYIRHPIFVSLALIYLGLTMIFLHPISFILWVLALLLGIYTSIKEEEFMLTKFPEYKSYMKKTGRFFPKFLR